MPGTAQVLYLVRHGRTALNAQGVLRGRLDPPLDAVGTLQARALAKTLGSVGIGAVLSSPLRRALQTAEAIAEAAGTNVLVDDRLVDRDYGRWAGLPPSEVEATFGSLDAAPGIEPRPVVAARAAEAATWIADLAHPKAAVVVAHDAVNREVIRRLLPLPPSDPELAQRPGAWSKLQLTEEGWTVCELGIVPDRS